MGLGSFISSDTIAADSRATLDIPYADFSVAPIMVTLPANSRSFEIPTFFTINDDNIDENEESFVIFAEILDIPENITCFLSPFGIIPCSRLGATEIIIADNDPMVIGFTQRIRTVSESSAPEGDFFPTDIDVATLRTAERVHPMVFRLQMSTSSAIVEPVGGLINPLLDAVFGTRDELDGAVEERFDLERLVDTIPPLSVGIRNDMIDEGEECFTIRIFPIDVPGRRELFSCNEDNLGTTNYFCKTTICIEDDDSGLIEVGYDPVSYVTSETAGFVDLIIRVFSHPGGSPRPFSLAINTEDGTATVIDGDYLQVSGQTIHFNAGDATQTHRIMITNNYICGNDDIDSNFFSNIFLHSGVSDIFVTVPRATVTIENTLEIICDPFEVGYEFTEYVTTEQEGFLRLCVVIMLVGGAPGPFVISLTSEDGVAVSDVDYVSVSDVELLFGVGDQRVCHDIEIIDDNICEPEPFEDFFVNLELTSGVMPILIDQARKRVVINETNATECNQNSGFSCTADGVTEVTIHCSGVGAETSLQCSFDNGPFHSCHLPIILNSNVSPPGNYNVTIVPSTGRELTVFYKITTESTQLPASVPPLEVFLNNGFPQVTESSVEAEFVISRPVATVTCFLRSRLIRVYEDCSKGRVLFTSLRQGRYILKIIARNKLLDVASLKTVVTI